MTTIKINQKEYLKKYLSSNIGDEKKKKKKKSKSKKTVKIIDDDIDLSKIETHEDDMDIFQTGEDAPQIVGVIDDRPPELQALDYQNSNKWKAVNNDNFSKMLNAAKPSCSTSRPAKESSQIGGNKKKKDLNRSPIPLENDDLSPYSRRDSKKRTDSSPRRKTSKMDYSPEHRKHKGDLSPKRHKSRKYDDDLSPKRYTSLKDNDADLSPRRNKNKRRSEDLSPKRYKSKQDTTKDLSPKRSRNRKNHEDDLSPKRSKQRQYNEDLSPKRYKHSTNIVVSTKTSRIHKNIDDDLSSKRYKSPPDSGRDLSPKQHRTRRASDVDLSPNRYQSRSNLPKRTRKSRFDSPCPYQRRSTSLDNSPKRPSPPKEKSSRNRLSRSASFDLSPPRKSTNKISERHNKRGDNYSRNSPSPPRHSKFKQEDDSPPPTHSKMMTKTLDGKTAGLSNAKALRTENAKFKEHEQKLFEKMTDEMSGRHADVVMRDRSTGKRRNFEEESEKQRRKDEKEEAKKAVYDRWGAGLKQVEEHKVRLEEISHEMNKPLARYSNDQDLDAYLKKQERHGDPMLEYIRQKEREKNKKQGIPEMPRYEGSFPDNRFNIRPGYRWDGVDRSNGFEKKWFETISKKKAVEEEAYRYSTEDM